MSWKEVIDGVDAGILDDLQSGFPVRRRPFATASDELGIGENELVERIQSLVDRNLFRRFGAVLNPPVIGSSMLAALDVSEGDFDDVADLVNRYRQVNHNYRRDHDLNLWFVMTCRDRYERRNLVREINDQTGYEVLELPMLKEYYIDLEFPVVNEDEFARQSLQSYDTRIEPTDIHQKAIELSREERRLLLEIQDGFPLTTTPYLEIAESLNLGPDTVVSLMKHLREKNCIKRLGGVVNHLKAGFDSNCMVVWDVPDPRLDEVGITAGQAPYVTYCCHRPRREKYGWSYNMFTMVHGRDRDAVDAKIDELKQKLVFDSHTRLHTIESLKQTGARYDYLLETSEGLKHVS